MPDRPRVATLDDLLGLLDGLFDARGDATSRAASAHWDAVLSRDGHPLAVDLPDASLVAWRGTGVLPLDALATALDVGCGLGRNARWLARQGLHVTGVDIAPSALRRAREAHGPAVTYRDVDVLRERVPGAPFDLVYDSGCFHHLAPHRRLSYVAMLRETLAPGGWFGLCTFAAGSGAGSTEPDDVLLRAGRVGEGVAYTTDELAAIFAWLEPVAAGPLPTSADVGEPVFSHGFLTTALFRRPA